MKRVFSVLLIFLLLFSLFVFLQYKKDLTAFAIYEKDKSNFSKHESKDEKELEKISNIVDISLVAVGDVMMHTPQIWSGYEYKTDKFNFDYFFDEVREDITSGDIAIANLETTLAGKEKRFTGYPLFNAPDEIADALKNAGFDIIVTSNNHSMDRGEEGVLRTIKVLEERGLVNVGTNKSGEENILRILNVKGVKIGFLAYTYGTNGIPVKKSYLVNIIDEAKVLKDVSKAKNEVDVLVVYFHFGNEYQRKPSDFQRELSKKVIEEGADIVIGSHPHVVQSGEWIFIKDENLNQKKYVHYSLGNFISAQKFPYTDEGLMLRVNIEVDKKSNKVYIKEVEEIPTWVHRYRENGKIKFIVKKGRKPKN